LVEQIIGKGKNYQPLLRFCRSSIYIHHFPYKRRHSGQMSGSECDPESRYGRWVVYKGWAITKASTSKAFDF